ncbi:hypothetical protein OEB94_38220, partial [Streptomyces sp. ICN988]|nr:hypothetical protein [Streptomyces sp. ICN988]
APPLAVLTRTPDASEPDASEPDFSEPDSSEPLPTAAGSGPGAPDTPRPTTARISSSSSTTDG